MFSASGLTSASDWVPSVVLVWVSAGVSVPWVSAGVSVVVSLTSASVSGLFLTSVSPIPLLASASIFWAAASISL